MGSRTSSTDGTVTKVVQPGKWYLAVDCAGCGEPIPFAETVSPEEKPDPIQYRTIANLTCPQCGHVGTYAPALMSRRPGPEPSDETAAK
jgi:hypothetical protein